MVIDEAGQRWGKATVGWVRLGAHQMATRRVRITRQLVAARAACVIRLALVGFMAAAASLAIGATGTYELFDNATPASAAQTKLIHKNSSIKTQTLLDQIRHTAIPDDPAVPQYKFGWVHPTSGYMYASTFELRDNCPNFYPSLEDSSRGPSFVLCKGLAAALPFPVKPSKHNQYVHGLNSIGNEVENSVHLIYKQTVGGVIGNRSKMTVEYICIHSGSKSTNTATTQAPKGIRDIVLQKVNNTANYSRATITLC